MQSAESRQFFVYNLPLVRGICIAGVILIHVSAYFMTMNRFSFLTCLLVALNSLARFAVPLFIVFSGFWLSLNSRNEHAGPFYGRTLRYLLIPYAAYSVLYTTLHVMRHLGSVRGLSNEIGRLPYNLLTASAASHLWFVALIVQFYLLHPYLARWYREQKHHGAIVCLAFLLQIGYGVLLILAFPTAEPPSAVLAKLVFKFGSKFFLSGIGYFVAGYYLLQRSEELRHFSRCPLWGLAGWAAWIFAAAGISAWWIVPLSRGQTFDAIRFQYIAHTMLTPLLACGALIAIVTLSQSQSAKSNVLARVTHSLGLYSYGVYYLHLFILKILAVGLSRALHLDHNGPVFYVLLFILTVGATLGAVRLLARLPFGRYLT
jgi:surface polysaccharide O-acyltransferase-like enzyme